MSMFLYLHVQMSGGDTVFQYFSCRVEVREGGPFLHVCQHGRICHLEPAIPPAAVPSTSQHVEERVFVDRVLALAQTFRAVLVGGSETIVRLITQTDEAVAAPFHFKETWRSFAGGASTLERSISTPDRRVDVRRMPSRIRRNVMLAFSRFNRSSTHSPAKAI